MKYTIVMNFSNFKRNNLDVKYNNTKLNVICYINLYVIYEVNICFIKISNRTSIHDL